MRTCPKCAAEVVREARFCPHCGSPLAAIPVAAPAAAVAITTKPEEEDEDAPNTVADPFSHTMPADPAELDRVRALIAQDSSEAVPVRERHLGRTKALEATPDPAAGETVRAGLRDRTLASPVVSPIPSEKKAVEVPKPAPSEPRSVDRPSVHESPASRGGPVSSIATTHGPVSPKAETGSTKAISVGVRVRVLWSDGQSYPAIVMQLTPTHTLVRFDNGHTQWVEPHFVRAE